MRKFSTLLGAAALVFVAAMTTLAQSAPPADASGGVALGGYCPVAYAMMNQAMKGDPQHKSVHSAKTYHFANADAKKMFDAAPTKYLPAYDGLCATAVAMGMKLTSNPQLFTVHEGRTFLFSDAKAKAMFDQDKTNTIAKADAQWPKVKQAK
jgi:YHS domain-containing protein